MTGSFDFDFILPLLARKRKISLLFLVWINSVKNFLVLYQGHVSAALVLDGVDVTGPHLHIIYPHGSTDSLPFAIMGSGSLAAMAVFKSRYAEGINRDDGVALVRDDIRSGIFNDLGSGTMLIYVL
ncbi:hypothetical protein AgCh_009896 [Apium graveolens]